MTTPPGKRPIGAEAVLVGVAVLLVIGLFGVLVLGAPLATGTRLVGPDGCTAEVWRNPVTGRIEAVGRSRLSRNGAPLCLDSDR